MHAESIGGCSPQIPSLLGCGVVMKRTHSLCLYHLEELAGLSTSPALFLAMGLQLACSKHRIFGSQPAYDGLRWNTVQRDLSQAFDATFFSLTVAQFKATDIPVGFGRHEPARTVHANKWCGVLLNFVAFNTPSCAPFAKQLSRREPRRTMAGYSLY